MKFIHSFDQRISHSSSAGTLFYVLKVLGTGHQTPIIRLIITWRVEIWRQRQNFRLVLYSILIINILICLEIAGVPSVLSFIGSTSRVSGRVFLLKIRFISPYNSLFERRSGLSLQWLLNKITYIFNLKTVDVI